MSALLFPGQGSQVVGMCAEFYNNFSLVKNTTSYINCQLLNFSSIET